MKPKLPTLLEETLSYSFHNSKLLGQALAHKSYINENRDKGQKDNERLEFLGDAVLDLVMCEYLIERYPESPEGDLSKMKSKIVNEETLAEVSKGIGLGSFLLVGKGEIQTDGIKKPSLLSDAMEALIAAIYLDSGLLEARKVILHVFEMPLRNLSQGILDFDYKTRLQEYSQKVFGDLPVYLVTNETGPDHQKRFEVKVSVSEEICGVGVGKSKKAAEQKAAEKVLSILKA